MYDQHHKKYTQVEKEALIPLPPPVAIKHNLFNPTELIAKSDSAFPMEPGKTSFDDQTFKEIADLALLNFGIRIRDAKRTLILGRILPMLEKYGFKDHHECLTAIKQDASGTLLSELANRLSTNHTAFFREKDHFSFLSQFALPAVTAAKERSGTKDLRVWCAAAATGEEPYSILFTMMDWFGPHYADWRAGLLATDISTPCLDVGRNGIYSWQLMEPIPGHTREKYFIRPDVDNYQVRPEIRSEITFRRFNLITKEYPFHSMFDIIFCRNVMIYFTNECCQWLLRRLAQWIVQGGFLFLGHSESLLSPDNEYFEYIAPAVYRRR